MSEFVVEQRTDEWFRLRRRVCVTASCFADAIGVGRGKPYDYLRSIVAKLDGLDDDGEEDTSFQEHGIRLEPVINSAYQLLTGYTTRPAGFWVASGDGNQLAGLIGASPDAKVYEKISDGDSPQMIGVAEFKAPVHAMYRQSTGSSIIPRKHMVQMQGQMAVCGAEWCDYMALCTKTKEIALLRVHFAPVFWATVSALLKDFCSVVQIVRDRHCHGIVPVLDFPEAEHLKSKQQTASNVQLPGESSIRVDNLLKVLDENGSRHYQSQSGTWMSYDFLVGEDPEDDF